MWKTNLNHFARARFRVRLRRIRFDKTIARVIEWNGFADPGFDRERPSEPRRSTDDDKAKRDEQQDVNDRADDKR